MINLNITYMLSIEKNILSEIRSNIIVLNSDKDIIHFNDNINDIIYSENIKNKNISDLQIGCLLEDIINDNIRSSYMDESIFVQKYNDNIVVNDLNKDLNYTIDIQYSDNKNITIFFNIIDSDKFNEYSISLLSTNSDIVAEIKDINNIQILYMGDMFDINDIKLDTRIYENDKQKITEYIENDKNEKKSINIRILIDNNWELFRVHKIPSDTFTINSNQIITCRNISHQYKYEQRRTVINRVLRHDLRNDMNVIRGYAENIKTNNENERSNKFADKIIEKSDRLTKLGNEIREIDQELNRIDRDLRKIKLRNVVEDCVKDLHKDYPESKFMLEMPEVSILGNTLVHNLINQVIENAIIHNNKKPKNKEVRIRSEYNKDSNKVKLIISDNGPGMNRSEKDIILSGIEKPLEHTNGLGLWMVKWVIDLMGGDVMIDEEYNKGTKIVLEFYHSSYSKDNIKTRNHNIITDLSKVNKLNDDNNSSITTTTRD